MARHAGIRLTLVGVATLGLVAAARAQPTEGVPSSEPDASTVRTNAGPPPREKAPVVLFLVPPLEPEVQGQLREAFLAQFALIEATVDFEPATGLSGSLSQRMTQAQTLSAERGAIAAFWIEEQPDGRWFVHMMDSEQERIIVRPVDAQGERRASAIEAVAVMARESTRALIEGVPEPVPAPVAPTASAPTPAPAAAPAVEPPPPPPRFLRVWAGYSGNAFAPQVGWQHAAAVGMSFMGLPPVYGGLGYLFTPPAKVDSPAFTVERLPLMAYLGYRYLQDRIALDGQLGISVEWLIRDASPTQASISGVPVKPAGQQSTHRLAELSPRLRIELRLRPDFGLYAGGGADILLNQITYVLRESSASTSDQVKLSPNRVRPMAELGLALYP